MKRLKTGLIIIMLCMVIMRCTFRPGFVDGYDFTITIPDNKVAALRDALCITWDYEGSKLCLDPNCAEYESKKAFLERKVRHYLKERANRCLEDSASIAAMNAVVPIEYE